MSGYDRPLPDVHRPRSAPFWAGTRQGRLLIQRCSRCHYLRFPPTRLCPECLGADHEWSEVSPTGTLYSLATYRRALDKRFEGHVPYTVAHVQLDEGPRIVGTLEGGTASAEVGSRVVGVFDPVTPEVTLLRWRTEGADVNHTAMEAE